MRVVVGRAARRAGAEHGRLRKRQQVLERLDLRGLERRADARVGIAGADVLELQRVVALLRALLEQRADDRAGEYAADRRCRPWARRCRCSRSRACRRRPACSARSRSARRECAGADGAPASGRRCRARRRPPVPAMIVQRLARVEILGADWATAADAASMGTTPKAIAKRASISGRYCIGSCPHAGVTATERMRRALATEAAMGLAGPFEAASVAVEWPHVKRPSNGGTQMTCHSPIRPACDRRQPSPSPHLHSPRTFAS